jgi:hypothetical protein
MMWRCEKWGLCQKVKTKTTPCIVEIVKWFCEDEEYTTGCIYNEADSLLIFDILR